MKMNTMISTTATLAGLLLTSTNVLADQGLIEKIKGQETFTRSIKLLNDYGPVVGRFTQDFTETTGSKFSFSKTTEVNKTVTNTVHANASISVAMPKVSGTADAGWENTVAQYSSTINSMTKEVDNTRNQVRHYELENGMEGYVALVTDSAGGFSNTYFTQNKNTHAESKTLPVEISIDYTGALKKFLGKIKFIRRNARDNGYGWDSLYNAADAADHDQTSPFLTYCNQMASFSDGMDSGSWQILSASATKARNLYNQKKPKEAMLEFLQGFYSIRAPSKNSSEWSFLTAEAQNMIQDIRGD